MASSSRSHTARPVLRTSEGRVSSTRMLGPVASGPKAQMERAASRSQSYLVWKNSPSFFLAERRGRELGAGTLCCWLRHHLAGLQQHRDGVGSPTCST